MILNVGMFFWKLELGRVQPAEARLLTWECTTNFDEIPDLGTLESLFEKEFPRTCCRLQECGGIYRIWHLVSFNSSEGRRSRFLVALVEKPFEKSKRRVLPAQIWFAAAADQMIRSKNLQVVDGNCDGNYLCYGFDENMLRILVFFEGRLCHWSEEVFAEGLSECVQETKMNQALERFRRFLKSDALFSRAKCFEEICLQEKSALDLSRVHFRRASRDSFWRGRDLQKPESISMDAAHVAREFAEGLLGHKWGWLLALTVIGVAWNWRTDADWNESLKNAVAPNSIELSLPPERTADEELRDLISLQEMQGVSVAAVPRCELPDFSLKGVVGEKLAIITLESATRALHGEGSRTLVVGDSLGSFTVHAIGRERMEFICGDSSIVKKVGTHEL